MLESGEAEQLASILIALATGQKRGSTVQVAALREIADRTEGKARQSVEVGADFSSTLAERIAEGRKQARSWQRSFTLILWDCYKVGQILKPPRRVANNSRPGRNETAPADALAAMAKLESAIPQLGNSWATESTQSQLPVAVN